MGTTEEVPMAHRMNVLVTDSERGAGDTARDELTAAGHTVMRCHAAGAAPFPCKALEAGGTCPLDATTVDVVLAVRRHPRSQPARHEDGVACALRRHIPLVVAGSEILNPYADYANAIVALDADLVDA